MTSIRVICWYLCGLFVLGLLAASAMSVVPEAEAFRSGIVLFNFLAAVLSGGIAIVSGQWKSPPPRWVLIGLQTVAVLATGFILLSVG